MPEASLSEKVAFKRPRIDDLQSMKTSPSPSKIVIREAREAEISTIVDMASEFMRTVENYRSFPPDEERLTILCRNLISSDQGAVFVAERERIIGMIGLFAYPHPYSGQWIAAELAWWIRPENRGSRAGLLLVRRAERWARDLGVTFLQMVAPDDHVAGFYRRLGYVHLEDLYQLELK